MASASSKSQLNASITAFGAELSSFVQRASDSITALKRTSEQRPQAGVQDFKECLDDLEQQVADFTDEVQQLAQYTSESISFEELIGHCSAVYNVNRATVLALEQHLAQYGYQQPANAVLEPESLQSCMQDNTDGLYMDDLTGFSARTRMACSTPTSPVSKGRGSAAGGHLPSRLGRSQPGSPTAAYASATGLCPPVDTRQLRDSSVTMSLGSLPGLASAAGGNSVLQTQLRQQQQSRVSLSSNTSTTPAGLLISPGVAALANKYATSSVGGSSVGALSLPEQPSTGATDRPKRSPVRDLNLSYSLADVNSPDLPIFGRTSATPPAGTAAGAGTQHRRQQELETPLGQQQGRSCEEDSTGELYSSLIHSNMQGMGRSGAECDTPEMEVTPPCTRSGVSPCSSPVAPPTAGRLPPNWASEKMQQLENLQADVTLTLSQMKRCPSRSRTRTPTPAASEDSSDDEEVQNAPVIQHHQQPQQQRQQQQQQDSSLQQSLQQDSRSHASGRVHAPGSIASTAGVAADHSRDAAHVASQVKPVKQQEGAAAAAAAAATAAAGSSTAALQAPSMQRKSSRAAPATDRLAAAAAAASADLEILMASLSMKYALGEGSGKDAAGAAGAAGGGVAGDHGAPQARESMEVDSEPLSPISPVASTPLAPAAASAAAAGEAGGWDDLQAGSNREQQPAGVGGSTLLTPATQQTIRRVVALGGTAARPQSSIRRMQPTTDVHRLEEIRGFYHQAGMLPQQLDARLSFAEPAAAAAAPCTSTGGPVQEAATAAAGRSAGSVAGGSSSSVAEARVQAEQQSVLRQVQVQDHAAAGPSGGASVHAAAGLRQSRQQQQQDRPKQQQLQAVQQPAEALTPRAARLQRRLQQQQQQQQVDQHDAENTCPAGKVAVATGGTGSCLAVASGSSCAGVAAVALRQKVASITADEYGTLPSWCRSLLSVELLNAVLQELSALPAGRGAKAAGVEVEGFTADDVALLGHSSSKSKTIVSCLHKLGRATLQRSASGANVYKLAAGGGG